MKTSKLASLSVAVAVASAGLAGCGAGTTVKAQWERFFTGTTAGDTRIDWVKALRVDSYGNAVAAGSSIEASGSSRTENILVASHNSAGDVNWIKTFDLPKTGYRSDEMSTASAMDEAGNTYVVGSIVRFTADSYENAGFLIKVDTYGNLVWSKVFAGEERIQDVEYNNGLVYVGGSKTRVFSADGISTLEINHGEAYVWDIDVDSVGNIYACGGAFVAKFAADGATLWSVSNPADVNQHCTVSVSQYGEVYAAHEIYFNDQLRVAKINEYGVAQWAKTLAEPASDAGAITGLPLVKQAPDGSVYAVSSTAQGRKLYKLDAQGNTLWSKTSSDSVVQSLHVDNSGNTYIYGRGKGEKFDATGKSLAKMAAPFSAEVTTGDAVVVGNAIYVADTLNRNGVFTGYLAKYNNQ